MSSSVTMAADSSTQKGELRVGAAATAWSPLPETASQKRANKRKKILQERRAKKLKRSQSRSSKAQHSHRMQQHKPSERDDSASDCDSDLDLNRELLAVGQYVHDREEMLEHMFRSISTKKLRAMLPESCKELRLEELKTMCLEQLDMMSRKRILRILDGADPDIISSTDSEEDSSDPEQNDDEEDDDDDEEEEEEDHERDEDDMHSIGGRSPKEESPASGASTPIESHADSSQSQFIDSTSLQVDRQGDEVEGGATISSSGSMEAEAADDVMGNVAEATSEKVASTSSSEESVKRLGRVLKGVEEILEENRQEEPEEGEVEEDEPETEDNRAECSHTDVRGDVSEAKSNGKSVSSSDVLDVQVEESEISGLCDLPPGSPEEGEVIEDPLVKLPSCSQRHSPVSQPSRPPPQSIVPQVVSTAPTVQSKPLHGIQQREEDTQDSSSLSTVQTARTQVTKPRPPVKELKEESQEAAVASKQVVNREVFTASKCPVGEAKRAWRKKPLQHEETITRPAATLELRSAPKPTVTSEQETRKRRIVRPVEAKRVVEARAGVAASIPSTTRPDVPGPTSSSRVVLRRPALSSSGERPVQPTSGGRQVVGPSSNVATTTPATVEPPQPTRVVICEHDPPPAATTAAVEGVPLRKVQLKRPPAAVAPTLAAEGPRRVVQAATVTRPVIKRPQSAETTPAAPVAAPPTDTATAAVVVASLRKVQGQRTLPASAQTTTSSVTTSAPSRKVIPRTPQTVKAPARVAPTPVGQAGAATPREATQPSTSKPRGAAEPVLSENQMEILELEMRARAIKAMLNASATANKQT